MDTQYCTVVDRPIESVPVPQYTDEEHGTWALLLSSQEKLVQGRACEPFIEGLRRIEFPKDRIPMLKEVSQKIKTHTGWTLLRVDGLVHPTPFFELLSRCVFPSTDFIRKRSELMYTPAPDMFHDLFGHAPLLTDPDFTEFFRDFGKVGVAAAQKFAPEHEIHQMLARMYWFTVEFGLIENSKTGLRAFGSGSVSSPEELQFCVGPKCKRIPFSADAIAAKSYDIWHLQEEVFVIESFEQLGREFRAWAGRHGIKI
jgi:phenylalanine-4-hydroxylase